MSDNKIGKLQLVNGSLYYLMYKNNHISLFKSEKTSSIVKIETINDSDKSLNNKYFILSTPSQKFCIYFNVDGLSVGPQVSLMYSNIEIPITNNESADSIATKIKNKLNADFLNDFIADVLDNVVTVTTLNKGVTSCSAIDGNTGFKITIDQYGQDEFTSFKSEIPDKSLYEILEASVSKIGDLKILGIYKSSRTIMNEYNKPVLTNEYFKDVRTYVNWVGEEL